MARRRADPRNDDASSETFHLKWLSTWINASVSPERLIARKALHKQDAALAQIVENVGLFRRDRLAISIDCPECIDPHTVEVLRRPDGGFHYFCIHNGWVDVSETELGLLRFDRVKLLVEIARAANLPGRRLDHYADGRLVRLGFVEPPDGSSGWTLAYADGLGTENSLSGVFDAIADQFSNGPGLVVTPSRIPISMPLPRNYKFMALERCFRFGREQLALDVRAVATRLRKFAKSGGKVGRPSFGANIELIWLEEREKPDWPRDREDQAQRILQAWPNASDKRPEPGTVENWLSKLERKYTSADGVQLGTKSQNR